MTLVGVDVSQYLPVLLDSLAVVAQRSLLLLPNLLAIDLARHEDDMFSM